MDRIVDFVNVLLGRRRGTKVVLGALAQLDHWAVKLLHGAAALDAEIEAHKTEIENRQQKIGELTAVQNRAMTAYTNYVKLTTPPTPEQG